ncbi:MAG: hypothetical protein IJV88_03765 [Ruminococcus sp.]|nr:hypothetical protein [Ruminococcus sp.]
MVKDTGKIIEELGLCENFRTFYSENKEYMVSDSLSDLLAQILCESNLKKSQVIRDSELSEVYAYQIFSGVRVPERKKLLSLCIGMRLNLQQVQTLLRSAGYPQLYVKLPFDSIVIYGVCNNLTVPQINELLYDYGFETLG